MKAAGPDPDFGAAQAQEGSRAAASDSITYFHLTQATKVSSLK